MNDALGPLFDLDLGGNPLAARLDYTGDFNSGVLLIDLEKWREEKITERSLAWALEKGEELKFVDQDSLNAIIGDRYIRLDQRWNAMRRESPEKAAIIHFTGMKPNHAECQNPGRFLYLDHRKDTPWATVPLISQNTRKFRRLGQSCSELSG